jgi:hypothetical protein
MITDSNTTIGFMTNILAGMVGGTGSFLLLGILLFLVLAVGMIYMRVRAGTAIMIGACLSVMLAVVVPEFGFLFWLAILVAGFMLINAIRKMLVGVY